MGPRVYFSGDRFGGTHGYWETLGGRGKVVASRLTTTLGGYNENEAAKNDFG